MLSSYYNYYFGSCYEREKIRVEKDFSYVSCAMCDKRIVISLKTEPYKSVCGSCYEAQPRLKIFYEGKIRPKIHPKYIIYSQQF